LYESKTNGSSNFLEFPNFLAVDLPLEHRPDNIRHAGDDQNRMTISMMPINSPSVLRLAEFEPHALHADRGNVDEVLMLPKPGELAVSLGCLLQKAFVTGMRDADHPWLRGISLGLHEMTLLPLEGQGGLPITRVLSTR
jgi:hypothetical protein